MFDPQSMGFQMNLESNNVIAFVLVLDGFLIVSKKCWLISICHFLFLIIEKSNNNYYYSTN